jgi:DnaD/phage-associated family protein
MSRTVLTEVDGFTPVIDDVVEATSLMTAVVFGRIWRFCQMPDGVCNASLEKIAESIGIDKATVMRHAKTLVDAGYLEDCSPDLRNHPHTYKDTGKAGLHIGVSSVADSNAGVAQCNAGVAESKLKIDIKRDIKTDSTTTTNSFFETIQKSYEANIGLMVPIIAREIQGMLEQGMSAGWITDAISEAARCDHRNWAYITAILKRWKVEGRAPKQRYIPKSRGPRVEKAPTAEQVVSKVAAWMERR